MTAGPFDVGPERGRQATEHALMILTASLCDDDPTVLFTVLRDVANDLAADTGGVIPLVLTAFTIAKTMTLAAARGDTHAALDLVQQLAAQVHAERAGRILPTWG